jgi:hypothetical protein
MDGCEILSAAKSRLAGAGYVMRDAGGIDVLDYWVGKRGSTFKVYGKILNNVWNH